MSILRDFERRLEGAVEGLFARAFRSGLQPVELARAVQRYADANRQVGVDGIIVPNEYLVSVSEADHARLEGMAEQLRAELGGVLRRTADERGWRLMGAPRITLEADEQVREGTYVIRGRVAADRPVPGPRAPEPPAEPRAPVPTAPAGHLAPQGSPPGLRVEVGEPRGQRFDLDGGTAVIGRQPDCEVRLDHPSISRRHARVARSGDGWRIEDLGSTNGVWVNGRKVERARLRHGDRVDLGGLRLAFVEEAGR